MELELKHIASYLPYKLNGRYNLKSVVINYGSLEVRDKRLIADNVDFFIQFCTPLLRPLSSLDTHELIVDLGGEVSDAIFDWCSYFNSDNQNKDAAILCAPFPVIEWCCKNHIDIFSLIDKGLAIAIED